MKKLLACILGVLMMLGVFVTPVSSEVEEVQRIEIGGQKHVHLFLTAFYDMDYYKLLKATVDMKEGDCLKITIMSSGGPALPTLAMLNHIESLKAKGIHITTESAGAILSAGAMLWITGQIRIVHSSDAVMFHTVVVRGPYGPVKRDTLPKEGQWLMKQLDYYMRQYLLDIIHDTEKVNELMNADGNKEGETNENWYTGEEIFKMGIATELQ